MKIARTPKIVSDQWRICTMPDLGDLAGPDPDRQHVVDHHFYQRPDGSWALWGAIRGAKIGHPIFGWIGDSLEQGPWRPDGIKLRAESRYGERVNQRQGELVCAPFFIKHDGVQYCFYNSEGIHRLESQDGYTFTRVLDANGCSRNHIGGRDPMVLKIDDLYYAYSCVSTLSQDNWAKSFVIVRTSKDLCRWFDYTIVSEGGIGGNGPVSAESPFVVQLDGYFYLFRSSSISFDTYVYRSDNPCHFGINDDSKLICVLPLKAPEIIHHQDQYYISDLADFQGIKMAKLSWEEDQGDR